MRKNIQFIAVVLIIIIFSSCTSTKQVATEPQKDTKLYELATVGFYNLENLFDTIVDPDPNKILQDEFTPNGKNHWTGSHYKKKIVDMSNIIAKLGSNIPTKSVSIVGADAKSTAPMIVGLSEVENKGVVVDLTQSEALKPYNYGVVHYESPDRRGIDVALIYRKDFVTIKSSESRRLYFPEVDDFRTRDQLVVEADLKGESIYIIVNHWPSRRGGEKRSSPRREAAAKLSRSIVDSLTVLNPNAKIIVMGDLNDDPTNKSVKKVLNTSADKNNIEEGQMYNPMEKKYKNGNGTGAYNDVWNLFDQLIISKPLVVSDTKSWKYYNAKIYKSSELIQQSGKYKNYPKRTYSFGSWIGGYSDHFPVYLFLIREK